MLRSSETKIALRRTPRPTSARAKRIITSGPQTRPYARPGSTQRARISSVTTPTSRASRVGVIDRDLDLESSRPASARARAGRAGPPGCARRRAGDAAVVAARARAAGRARAAAARARCRPRRRPRRCPRAASSGQAAAERAADTEHAPRARGRRPRDRAHRADRVHEPSSARGITADRDRHLAHAEDIEHVELAGRVGDAGAARGLELEREGVGGLAATRATRYGAGSVATRAADASTVAAVEVEELQPRGLAAAP